MQKVSAKKADQVSAALVKLLLPYRNRVLTITSDNGKEFAEHESIANQLNSQFYFAHPYHSWERGLNENTNGLIRQYIIKSMDFRSITEDQVEYVINRLNNRPRKGLGFKTPNEIFLKIKSKLLS